MRLSTCFQEFMSRPFLTQQTKEKYYYQLRSFITLHAEKFPNEIVTEDLTAYLCDKTNWSEASKAKFKTSLHAFFNFCGCSDNNPAKALPNFRDTPRRVILPSEEAVKKAMETAVSMIQSSVAVDVRDGLIFTLAVVSGNRRGEILNLLIPELLDALKHPEKVEGTAVYRAYTFGKTGEAILRFTEFHKPFFIDYLRLRPLGVSHHVFVNMNINDVGYGRSLSLVAFNRARWKVCERAGVDSITYQHLRRRLASMIADSQGVDVAAQALNHSPHSGDRVVRAYYYDPDKKKVDFATLSAFDILLGGLN